MKLKHLQLQNKNIKVKELKKKSIKKYKIYTRSILVSKTFVYLIMIYFHIMMWAYYLSCDIIYSFYSSHFQYKFIFIKSPNSLTLLMVYQH